MDRPDLWQFTSSQNLWKCLDRSKRASRRWKKLWAKSTFFFSEQNRSNFLQIVFVVSTLARAVQGVCFRCRYTSVCVGSNPTECKIFLFFSSSPCPSLFVLFFLSFTEYNVFRFGTGGFTDFWVMQKQNDCWNPVKWELSSFVSVALILDPLLSIWKVLIDQLASKSTQHPMGNFLMWTYNVNLHSHSHIHWISVL